MKRMLIIGSVLLSISVYAQDSTVRKKAWTFSGYLKDLAWVRFEKDFTNAMATNLVHNRMNLKWNPDEHWNARLELRNRFYWGDDVRTVPDFKQQYRKQFVHPPA